MRKQPNPFLALVTGGMFGVPDDPLAGIDIMKEYELIKRKQSNLPRAKRDLIVQRVEGGSR